MTARSHDPPKRTQTGILHAASHPHTPGGATLHRILSALRRDPSIHVSGTALASTLGISRTSVWKHVQALRSKGYHIDTHPRLGYRLTGVPDLILPEELLPLLSTRNLGRAYHHFNRTTSTNDEAMALALRGAPHGTLVVAEAQSRGRGRLQRDWASAASRGIYLSLLLRGPFPPDRAHQLTMLSALGLARLMRDRCGLEAWTKWPNDVLISGKKVAGILTEAQSDPDQVHFLVVGVGVNVNHRSDDLQGPFRYPATSLAMELGHELNRTEFLAAYLADFERDSGVFR